MTGTDFDVVNITLILIETDVENTLGDNASNNVGTHVIISVCFIYPYMLLL